MGSLEEEIRRQVKQASQAELESSRYDQERQRLIADFLNLMTEAGNPELRRWTIRRLGGMKRTGGPFSRRYESEILDAYVAEGWLLRADVILTLDGRFHYFSERSGETGSSNWSSARTVAEQYVKFDYTAVGDNASLRTALAQLYRTAVANR